MSYEPMFEMWRTEQDDVVYDVVLDLGHGESFPLGSHPWFFGVRIPMAEKTEDGLPSETESNRLDIVENRIRERVKTFDGIYVGRRTGGANRDVMFYLPERPRGLQDRIRSSIGMELLFISRSDGAWRGYEQLLPTPRELRQADDMREIDDLIAQGVDAAKIQRITHQVSTPSPKGAEALAKLFVKLELEDIEVSGERPDLLVVGVQVAPLDIELIHRVSWILESKAPKARGYYLGWSVDVEAAGPSMEELLAAIGLSDEDLSDEDLLDAVEVQAAEDRSSAED